MEGKKKDGERRVSFAYVVDWKEDGITGNWQKSRRKVEEGGDNGQEDNELI